MNSVFYLKNAPDGSVLCPLSLVPPLYHSLGFCKTPLGYCDYRRHYLSATVASLLYTFLLSLTHLYTLFSQRLNIA